MSLDSKVNKCIVVCSQNGILDSNENEQTTHKNVNVLDKITMHKKKYDSICMKFKTGKIIYGVRSRGSGCSWGIGHG